MPYEERHVIKYDSESIPPVEMKKFLEELKLGSDVCYQTVGVVVLRIPEIMESSLAKLEERFGELINIYEEPLTNPQIVS